jgi:hypothetical protein
MKEHIMKKLIGRMSIFIGGFSKTSVFGKTALDGGEKSGSGPLFQEAFAKPTSNRRFTFWESLIVLLLLAGCTTLETYVNPDAYDPRIAPIDQKTTFFIFGEQFIMGEYSLVYKDNTQRSTVGFFTDRDTTVRRYVFYKNKTPLYKVEIIKQERKIQFTDHSSIFWVERMYINIVDNNGVGKEYAINQDKPYITYNDDVLGTIQFDYYRSRNKNDIEYNWEYVTGFEIRVNDEAYGVLAFYPPSVYLKHYNDIEEKMDLYVLTAYASFLYT